MHALTITNTPRAVKLTDRRVGGCQELEQGVWELLVWEAEESSGMARW